MIHRLVYGVIKVVQERLDRYKWIFWIAEVYLSLPRCQQLKFCLECNYNNIEKQRFYL